MPGKGRPLRFLGTVLGGWIGLRVVLLWPQFEPPADVLRALAPFPVAAILAPPAAPPGAARSGSVRHTAPPRARAAFASFRRRTSDPTHVALALLGLVPFGDPVPVEEPDPLLPGVPRPIPRDQTKRLASRWSGSAWLVARGGAGIAPGGLGGQLGGSQAGARMAYLVDRRHRIALAARVTTPLGCGLREAALGVEWQPTRLPVRLLAEQRFAIDGGRSGPALGVVGARSIMAGTAPKCRNGLALNRIRKTPEVLFGQPGFFLDRPAPGEARAARSAPTPL